MFRRSKSRVNSHGKYQTEHENPNRIIYISERTCNPRGSRSSDGSDHCKISGTVGAATEAAKEGIPSIAFSGSTGSQTSYTSALQTYMTVYADLSTNVTQSLVGSGKPYLPTGIWLNVNYPSVSSSTCTSLAEFKFVLSRINSAGSSTPADVNTCGSKRLPTETTVVDSDGCFASISVGVATSKADASASTQAVVLRKLQRILSCLPS